MQEIDDETIRGILGEVVADELKIIKEYLEYLVPTVKVMAKQVAKIDDIEADLKTIKLVVRDHSFELQDYERRLVKLEAVRSN